MEIGWLGSGGVGGEYGKGGERVMDVVIWYDEMRD